PERGRRGQGGHSDRRVSRARRHRGCLMARRRRQSGAGEAAAGEAATVELVRRLGTLLTELGLTELEVTAGDIRVRLQRGVVAPTPPALAPAERSAAAHTAEIESASGVTIEA